MTKTYDTNHQIHFKKTSSGNQLEFVKYKTKTFSDQKMMNTFLEAYELSYQQFLALADEQAFHAHLSKIEKIHGCNHGLIQKMGIIHLVEQKAKQLVPLSRNVPDLKQSLIQQAQAWVQQPSTLPILEHTKSLLNTPMYQCNVASTLDNTLLVLTQQGFSTVEPLIRNLVELGYKASNIILFTKPHTTSESNRRKFEALQAELGIQYVAQPTEQEIQQTELNATEDDDVDETLPSHPNYIYAKTKKAALNKAIVQIKTNLNRTDFKNVIVHDEGGIFSKSIAFKNQCIDPFIQNKTFSMSEHTMSGIEAGQHLNVPFPCFSMAQSWLKTQVEAYFIAEKSFLLARESIENHLRQHEEVTISIVGLGNIGSQFATMMIEYAQNNPQKRIKIYVNDTNPQKLLDFTSNKFRPIVIEEKQRHDMFSQSDFLFGCTGKDITEGLTTETFNRHAIQLMSISSGNREFKSLLKGSVQSGQPGELHKHISNLDIKIQNEGRPIIFKEGEDDAIHPSKIQIIRAMTMATIFQQLNYLSQRDLLNTTKSTENVNQLNMFDAIKTRFIDIDAYLQQELWEAFKIFQNELPNHLMNGHESLKLKPEFLSKNGSFENIMEHNKHLRANLKIDNSKPHAGNFICKYDKNHDLHLIEVDDHFEFAFLKNGTKFIRDPYMDSKKLQEKGINLDQYYQMNFIEQMMVLKKHYSLFKTQTLNQTPAHRTEHQSLRNNR